MASPIQFIVWNETAAAQALTKEVGYLEVEELVAIVDPRTRKVEIVFPRWAE